MLYLKMQSKATTVQQYLDELPEDRRAAVSAIRDVLRKNMPEGIEECIGYGMIGYVVPKSIYPAGYHCDPKLPMPFANLGSQKNYISLHLMCAYMNPEMEAWLASEFKKAGKKLDKGKACLRFKKLEDAPLDVLGAAVARVPVKEYLRRIELSIAERATMNKAAQKVAKKTVAKKPVAKKK